MKKKHKRTADPMIKVGASGTSRGASGEMRTVRRVAAGNPNTAGTKKAKRKPMR